jgi:adenylate cyclase
MHRAQTIRDRLIMGTRTFRQTLFEVVSGGADRKVDEAVSGRLLASFRETERRGLMLASVVRAGTIVLMMLAFVVLQGLTGGGSLVLVAMVGGLAVIGLVQFEMLRRFPDDVGGKYVFAVLDCLWLTTFLIWRHDMSTDLPPVTVSVKEGALLFYIAILVQSAFSHSPRFILWTGGWIVASWLVVVGAALLAPGTFTSLPAGGEAWLSYGSTDYLPLAKVGYDFVIFLCILAGISVAVWRSRELVRAAVTSEKARANLARHFSPKVLDAVSLREQPFGATRRQSAVVLFADIRGFTTRCETMPPEEAIAFLRDFHGRMEDVIFRHGGMLDRILGDGLLAVFGIPDRGTGDAGDALACAHDMIAAVAVWNRERVAAGRFPVQIGIGLHHGPVVTGDLGSERVMTFTVVGDTVNVASRLQSLSKEIGTALVASDDVLAAIREEARHDARLLEAMQLVGARRLRGREHEIVVHALPMDVDRAVA